MSDCIQSPATINGGGAGEHLYRSWCWSIRPADAPPEPEQLGQILPIGKHPGIFRIDSVHLRGTMATWIVLELGARYYEMPLKEPVYVPCLQMLKVRTRGPQPAADARAMLEGKWFADPDEALKEMPFDAGATE